MTDTIELQKRIKRCRVVPVLTIQDASKAVDLAKAFIAGGIDVLEITLRTPDGLQAIRNIRSAGLDCVIGAGTVISEGDVTACAHAEADFLVTPATPPDLIESLLDFSGLVLPGCATPTEALRLYQVGFDIVKFFPAEAAGGTAMLKSLASPLPDIRFMPTGGITPEKAAAYLALPNVIAIGGSWLCSDEDISSANWAAITDKARQTSQI